MKTINLLIIKTGLLEDFQLSDRDDGSYILKLQLRGEKPHPKALEDAVQCEVVIAHEHDGPVLLDGPEEQPS